LLLALFSNFPTCIGVVASTVKVTEFDRSMKWPWTSRLANNRSTLTRIELHDSAVQCVLVSGSTQKHFCIYEEVFLPRQCQSFPVPLVIANIFVGSDAEKQNKQAKNNI